MIIRTSALVTLALVALTGSARAQNQTIDQGIFRLSVRGQPVGTETFTIQRKGEGPSSVVVAQARMSLDNGDETRTLLQTEGLDLRPTAYQIEVTGPDKQSIRGQAAGNRFRAQIVSNSGEMMREYLASEGAVIIDQGVAHQYYFLAPHLQDGASVPIIIPRESRQVSASISSQGRESIEIGGHQVSARKFSIRPAGMPERTIWVDDQGRVLRLNIPSQNYVAERTALP